MSKVVTCTVCNNSSSDNYCGNCGQKINKKETTFLTLMSDLISDTIDVEKSLFATLFSIILHPNKIIENYWNGFRKYYVSPGRVLIYALAVAALHLAYIDDSILGADIQSNQVESQFLFWILFMPFMILASYLTFIKSNKGLIKHIISVLYVGGTMFITITLLDDFSKLFIGDNIGLLSLIAFVLTVMIWNAIVFTSKKTFLRVALNVLLELLIMAGVLFILFIIFNLFDSDTISMVNPDEIEM